MMYRSLIIILLFTTSCSGSGQEDPGFSVPDSCQQVLLVENSSIEDPAAIMYLMERSGNSWTKTDSIQVVLGKNGLAADPVERQKGYGRYKQEGDKCSPAGTYDLLFAFGYTPDAVTRMPYRQMTEEDLCVDDVTSADYNQHVSRQGAVYNSAENMLRKDELYSKGLWVAYNSDPVVPENGSCIFLHIWRAPGAPTAGCTAMAEADMDLLFSWLDPEQHPILVQRTRF